METQYTILTYETAHGDIPLELWLRQLRDREARLRIMRRIQRMSFGNFGDHHGVGNGLSELRIDYGPGYRVYYFQDGKTLILLLCAGDKRTQNADIDRAKVYKNDYERRKK